MLQLNTNDLLQIHKQLLVAINNTKIGDIFEFIVTNPDEENSISYKSWIDLAQLLYCRMLTPQICDESNIVLRFQKLNTEDTFHTISSDDKEKYGTDSPFSIINKNLEASFLVHYMKALENAKVDTRLRILNLGVNSGEEFEVIKKYSQNFSNLELVGIDYCSSAIKKAKEDFSDENITFLEGDINKLEALDLGKFDLIITIGTLQSSNLDFNKVFMNIVQNYLNKDGAMILGFPNCRWCENEMIYGAKVKNYNFSEMSVLYKDVVFCKKYLQQKKFRVTITGKDYIFLTATSIRK
ncbi:class I SAM-dependent methyltransferase [Arcobacteraceae bacterium]|nr:class I SAM-dependent methyltransferase [Arcobacteraceae bacterium]